MTDVSELPEDELGVELDVAIDTAVDAAHVANSLRDMAAKLDALADNGDFAASQISTLRELQSDAAGAATAFETVENAQRARAEAIRERIQDVQDQ